MADEAAGSPAGAAALAPLAAQLAREQDELERALSESRRLAEAVAVGAVPLVRSVPLDELVLEYAASERAALYEAKVEFLKRSYRALWRICGDGNCLYRSFFTSMLEWLLFQPVELQSDLTRQLVLAASTRLNQHLPEGLGSQLNSLASAVTRRIREMCTLVRYGQETWQARRSPFHSSRKLFILPRPRSPVCFGPRAHRKDYLTWLQMPAP